MSTYHRSQLLIKVNDVGEWMVCWREDAVRRTLQGFNMAIKTEIVGSLMIKVSGKVKKKKQKQNLSCTQMETQINSKQTGTFYSIPWVAWNIIKSKPHWSVCNRN